MPLIGLPDAEMCVTCTQGAASTSSVRKSSKPSQTQYHVPFLSRKGAGLLQLGSGCAGVKGPLGELATCRVDPPAGEMGEATAESP